MIYLFYALLLTIVIEGLLLLLVTRSKQWVLQSVYCNLVTNPILNLILFFVRSHIGDAAETALIAVLEISVVFSEALLYRAMSGEKVGKCLLLSLAANAASYLSGLVIF